MKDIKIIPDKSSLIYNLETLYREIPLEKDDQLASMIKLFRHDIPYYIEALRKKEECNCGKSLNGSSKEDNPLHLPLPRARHEDGHKTMRMRLIPD